MAMKRALLSSEFADAQGSAKGKASASSGEPLDVNNVRKAASSSVGDTSFLALRSRTKKLWDAFHEKLAKSPEDACRELAQGRIQPLQLALKMWAEAAKAAPAAAMEALLHCTDRARFLAFAPAAIEEFQTDDPGTLQRVLRESLALFPDDHESMIQLWSTGKCFENPLVAMQALDGLNDPGVRQQLLPSVVRGLAKTDPPAAFAAMAGMDSRANFNLFADVIRESLGRDFAATAKFLQGTPHLPVMLRRVLESATLDQSILFDIVEWAGHQDAVTNHIVTAGALRQMEGMAGAQGREILGQLPFDDATAMAAGSLMGKAGKVEDLVEWMAWLEAKGGVSEGALRYAIASLEGSKAPGVTAWVEAQAGADWRAVVTQRLHRAVP